MSVTINLKKQVDLPVWEWTRFAPAATTALSTLTSPDVVQDNRYLYYLVGGTGFYRYDTITDTWQTLNYPTYSSGVNAPLTVLSTRHSSYGGYRGRILSGSTTTFLAPGIYGNILSGKTMRIYNGLGAGQERIITSVTEPTVYEFGVVTTATVSVLTDTTKKWKWNQWSGYQVSIIYGTGQTQRRKVLYNDATSLTFYDINYQAIDSWNNQGFATGGAYTAPVATAGSQAMYQIEASTYSIDTPFDITPDTTSRFVVQSGSIWCITSLASGAYHALYKYDVAADVWYTKTATAGLFPAAAGTDISIERISNAGGMYFSGTTTSATGRTLTDSSLNLTQNRYANYQIRTISGTGSGQRRRIVTNSNDTIYLNRKWDILPDTGTTYQVWDDLDMLYIVGHGSSSMYNYSIEADLTAQGAIYDFGVSTNMCLKMNGWEDVGITTATRNTNGIKTINITPVAGGSNHVVGDIITLGTGTNGKVMVESIASGGTATSLSLLACGTGYAVATASQSATTGSGTGLQVSITALATVGRITTAINHFFKIGDVVTFYGASEAAWNTTYTILGVDGITTLDVEISAASNAAAANTQSSTVLVCSSSNWDTNVYVGRIITISTAGPAPTFQYRRITANTATTLTLQSSITAAVNGTSRFIIYEPSMLGKDNQYKQSYKSNTGFATSGSTTTLEDSTKNWNVNQWTGYKFRILSGQGYGSEIVITFNSSSALTYTTQTFVPDSTTKYIIMDTYGLCTSAGSATVLYDTYKNWTVNQWAGKRVKITSGTGVSNETTITSNTATSLTAASGMGSPTTDSTYTILGVPVRGSGIQLMHVYGNIGPDEGKYLYCPRGSISNAIDRYNINEEEWDYGLTFGPNSETFTTGAMYAYDGHYTIILQKETGNIFSYDVRTNIISNCGTIPYGHSTLRLCNRMEVVETEDGLKYLYLMRSNSNEMWRTLLYWL